MPDQADPTGGRHAFDAEAALTPIFTTLRRGGWRRPRGPQGLGPRRPAPDVVDRFHSDPPTAPIPVVPALYAVDADRAYPAPPADPYPGHSFVPEPSPPPSNLETTTWWPAAVPADPHPAEYDHAPYAPIPDPSYEDQGYYGPPDRRPLGSAAWGNGLSPHDRGAYDRRGYERRGYDPTLYDPVTDTGRHHRRLAPAGW